MLISDRPHAKAFVLLGLVSALAACGGSSGGSPADMTSPPGADLSSTDLPMVADAATADLLPAVDAEQPTSGVLVVAPSAIAFGNGPCGGTAAPSQSVTFSNTGEEPLAIIATIDNPQFSFGTLPAGWMLTNGVLTGSVAAGQTATLELSTQPIAATATAGQALLGNLTLVASSNGTTLSTSPVPLSVIPFGATVVVFPAQSPTYQFGQEAVAMTISTAGGVVLSNAGNDAVAVSMGSSSDSQFSATVPDGSMLDAAGDGLPVTVAYTPQGAYYGSATIPIDTPPGTPICGNSQTSISLVGVGSTFGQLNANPTSLAWNSACGTQPAAQTFVITNSTGSAQPITMALDNGVGSAFSVSPNGTVSVPTTGLTVTVTPSAVSTTGGITPLTDTLRVSSDGMPIIAVPLTLAPLGGIIAWAPNPDPVAIQWVVQLGTEQTINQLIANTGNASTHVTPKITIDPGADGLFELVGAFSGSLLPQTTSSLGIFYKPSTTVGSATGSLALTTNDHLCAPLPPNLLLAGQAVNSAVTTSPATGSTIAFTGPSVAAHGAGAPPAGSSWCGTQATAQNIVFTNTGAPGTSYRILSATFASGTTQYTAQIAGAPVNQNVVDAGGSGVTMVISSNPVPSTYSFSVANPFVDTLTVVTSDVGDHPHTFVISQQPYGATLEGFMPTPTNNVVTHDFGFAQIGESIGFGISVLNAGNAPATLKQVSVVVSEGTTQPFTADLPATAPAANIAASMAGGYTVTPTSKLVYLWYTPVEGAGSSSATMTLDYTGAVLCGSFTMPTFDLSGS